MISQVPVVDRSPGDVVSDTEQEYPEEEESDEEERSEEGEEAESSPSG